MAVSLETALAVAEVCCKTNCIYGYDNCPKYWQRVFVLYFGDEPTGDQDPRWDKLFKLGMKTRFKMPGHEQEEEQKAAS